MVSHVNLELLLFSWINKIQWTVIWYLRLSFFWDVGSRLPTFRDSLSVPSSRVKQTKKDEMLPEMFSPFKRVSTRCGARLPSTEKSEWSHRHTSTPPYVFMAWTERAVPFFACFFVLICPPLYVLSLTKRPPLPWRSWPCSHVLFVWSGCSGLPTLKGAYCLTRRVMEVAVRPLTERDLGFLDFDTFLQFYCCEYGDRTVFVSPL